MKFRSMNWPKKIWWQISQPAIKGLLLLIFAAWTIRPVLQNPASCLPVQQSMLTTVPLLNAWTIWWNADRLSHGFAGYWDAPIFFPAKGTFAFSEPQPATLLVAPVVWMSGSPTLAYNVYLLMSLFLNGLLACRVLRGTGNPLSLSLLGGAMMIWLPLSVRQIDVLQLIPVWPMLWVWDVLRRHGLKPTWKTATELSVAYTLCVYSSIHHALFLSIALAGTAWVLWSRFLTSRFWLNSALAIVLASLSCGPIVFAMHGYLAENQFARSPAEIAQSAATVSDFVNTPRDAFLCPGHKDRMGMSPGWIKVSLCIAGCVLGVRRKRMRRWVMFLVLMIVVSGGLALGLNLQLAGFSPWQLLMAIVPGAGLVRNVYRFVYLTQMAVILLGITGLSLLQRHLSFYLLRRRFVGFVMNAIGLLGLLALLEVPAPVVVSAGVPDFSLHQAWTTIIREKCPPNAGILCLPLPEFSRAQDYDFTARWMMLGTQHRAPMVNGYSGFFPARSLQLQSDIRKNGFSAGMLTQLMLLNVQFVVIHPSDARFYELLQNSDNDDRLKLIFEDANGIRVYRLLANAQGSTNEDSRDVDKN